MRLTDLEPRWLNHNGQRVGFAFRSPDKLGWISCFTIPAPPVSDQWGIFRANGLDEERCHPCEKTKVWNMTVGDFASMTLTPSLHIPGYFHAIITGGEVKLV